MNAYIGFTHTHVSKPFQITNMLEAKLINYAVMKKMSFDDAAEVLYEFSQKQIGSKILIETLVHMIESDSADKYALFNKDELLNKHTSFKSIVALDSLQSKFSQRAIYQIGKMMDKTTMDYEELYTLKSIFSKNSQES